MHIYLRTIITLAYFPLAFSCQLRECEHWRITVIPLLTEEFNQLNVLKSLVQVLIEDCQWFTGNIDLRFLNKNDEFIRVFNFENQGSIDNRLSEFTYNTNETEFAYYLSIESAITEMPKVENGYGRYIFIATDFPRNNTLSNENELRIIDRHLKAKGIQMRSIRMDSSGNIGDPNAIINIQTVRNISSRFMRVSLTEANNIMDSVRPCRKMTEAEKIRNIQYERDFQFRYWLANNSWDITIGLVFFLSSILVAFASFLIHLWNTRRKNAKKFLNKGLGAELSSQKNKTTI